jgi:hypothetical protein
MKVPLYAVAISSPFLEPQGYCSWVQSAAALPPLYPLPLVCLHSWPQYALTIAIMEVLCLVEGVEGRVFAVTHVVEH